MLKRNLRYEDYNRRASIMVKIIPQQKLTNMIQL